MGDSVVHGELVLHAVALHDEAGDAEPLDTCVGVNDACAEDVAELDSCALADVSSDSVVCGEVVCVELGQEEAVASCCVSVAPREGLDCDE